MKSKDYYNKIYEESSIKMRRSLESIKKVCESFETQNVRISVGKVGNECERLFGSPKQQSIRNNPLLKNYIEFKISEQIIDKGNPFEGSKIKDPILRSEFLFLEDQVKTLQKENTEIKKLYEKITVSLNQGKIEFSGDNVKVGDVVFKLLEYLKGLDVNEYRGRLCLNKNVILNKEEYQILLNLMQK